MITVENLTKRYAGTTVVDDVSLTVERHSITAIVGTSGSGKSTLLRMINRLVEPSSGRVLLDGRDTRDEPAYLLRRHIGYVIQGNGLFPHRTVAENIATVPRLLGWEARRIEARWPQSPWCFSWTSPSARSTPSSAPRRRTTSSTSSAASA